MGLTLKAQFNKNLVHSSSEVVSSLESVLKRPMSKLVIIAHQLLLTNKAKSWNMLERRHRLIAGPTLHKPIAKLSPGPNDSKARGLVFKDFFVTSYYFGHTASCDGHQAKFG